MDKYPTTPNQNQQPRVAEKEKIQDLKAKCKSCEIQILALQDEIKRKNLGMESFIVVIKRYIEMVSISFSYMYIIEHFNYR